MLYFGSVVEACWPELKLLNQSKMGTWQSAINVTCCSSKKDDELSDNDREGEPTKEGTAVCVSQPWDFRHRAAPAHAPVHLPRSVSNATAIPTFKER